MVDIMRYREVRQRFSVRDDDGPDADLLPDRLTVTGVVEFEPRLPKGDVLTYPEEFVKPLPITARIVAGELYANWVESDQEEPRPLFVPVTVDDRADQTWSWIMRVTHLYVDGREQQIEWGAREFQVEAGDGPLFISQVTGDRKGGTITVRGPRGYGITDITADSGVVTVEWEGGDDVTIPIPTAALATPTSDGLMPKADKAKLNGLPATPIRFTTTAVYVSDGTTERLVSYDSGWRDMSQYLVNGWTGRVYARRVGGLVDYRIEGLSAANATNFDAVALSAATGMRISIAPQFSSRGFLHTTAAVLRRFTLRESLTVVGYQASDVLYGQITGVTSDPAPANLPGVPA